MTAECQTESEMSFRGAVAVPKSYRIDEFRYARRSRQSRSPEQAGSSPSEPFLNRSIFEMYEETSEIMTLSGVDI